MYVVTENDIEECCLEPSMLGAKVKFAADKKGGEFICKDCGIVVVVLQFEKFSNLFVAKAQRLKHVVVFDETGVGIPQIRVAPSCPNCGAKSVLKGATPLRRFLATVVMPDGHVRKTIIKRNAKDKPNKEVFKSVMLCRLDKANKLRLSFYDPFNHKMVKETTE